jgi:MarR family transcriptional regulator, negative regulator of the multidrug operon emrRAB
VSTTEERAFAANVLGTLALTVGDRIGMGTERAAGYGANAPAALVTLLWYPHRPITRLADRLRISHPGAVQLSGRLETAGLVTRVPGADGRTKLLSLTVDGEAAARAVLAERRDVLGRAVSAVDDSALPGLVDAVCAMLEALADTLLTSEFMCRLCDERSCPDDRCPVERAEPAPLHRRGAGYSVANSPGERISHHWREPSDDPIRSE